MNFLNKYFTSVISSDSVNQTIWHFHQGMLIIFLGSNPSDAGKRSFILFWMDDAYVDHKEIVSRLLTNKQIIA